MAEDTSEQPDEAEPAVPEEPQYREVSEEELERILACHKRWVETERQDGSRAALSNINLQGGNLQGANLQKATLRDANLRWANLRRANLQMADLYHAKLQGANLSYANLQGADLEEAYLQGADFTDAQNLTQEQLDAACGDDETTLPDDLADYRVKPCPEPERPPAN